MEKTWASRARQSAAVAWKSRFAGVWEVKNWKEGKKRVARASLAFGFFHLPRVSAAGVRRSAAGLHHIARPPPRLRSWGSRRASAGPIHHASITHHHCGRLRAT